jgi:hypothetical protein
MTNELTTELVVSGGEQMTVGTPEERGNACKEELTLKIKATTIGSFMNKDVVVTPGVDDLTTASDRCCGKQTIQSVPKAAVE